jgi:hypothetical protein
VNIYQIKREINVKFLSLLSYGCENEFPTLKQATESEEV